MSDIEPDHLDQDIKALFDADKLDLDHVENKQKEQLEKSRARVKANVAQRDTMLFAFIKIWTVLADMLAPVFASFAAKKVSTARKPVKKTKHQ